MPAGRQHRAGCTLAAAEGSALEEEEAEKWEQMRWKSKGGGGGKEKKRKGEQGIVGRHESNNVYKYK